MFFDEGAGQPAEGAAGQAPPGSVGACRVPNSKRPPMVNLLLWNHLKFCTTKTPRRYVRIGYGNKYGDKSAEEDKRMADLMEAVTCGC
jgi:hypothetical protein